MYVGSFLKLALLKARRQGGVQRPLTNTRVDVLFHDVRAMEIRAWFRGIRIEERDDPHFLNGQRSKPLDMLEPGSRIYALSSSGWEGFVVVGILRFVEDDGELFGPSALVSDLPVKRWTLG